VENKILRQDTVVEKLLVLANSDPDVKAVVMNGSRVNPNVVPDEHQDYDIAFYLASEAIEKYKKNLTWIDDFGSLVLYQLNYFGEKNYIFLIQYFSGLRIDISFSDIDELQQDIDEDSLSYILLDKENRIKIDPIPNDNGYRIKAPTKFEWQFTTNELLWIQICILKEIARGEMELAISLYNEILVPEFIKLLSWLAGKNHNWNINVGKSGRWLKKYIPNEMYLRCFEIYVGNGKIGIIKNIRRLNQLLLELGTEISATLEYRYPLEDHHKTYLYLERFIIKNNLE
jgi:aminoglycoside 6-adenylyltransferase